eukprot:1159268-Pelagomonas_calceolata.AAC.16
MLEGGKESKEGQGNAQALGAGNCLSVKRGAGNCLSLMSSKEALCRCLSRKAQAQKGWRHCFWFLLHMHGRFACPGLHLVAQMLFRTQYEHVFYSCSRNHAVAAFRTPPAWGLGAGGWPGGLRCRLEGPECARGVQRAFHAKRAGRRSLRCIKQPHHLTVPQLLGLVLPLLGRIFLLDGPHGGCACMHAQFTASRQTHARQTRHMSESLEAPAHLDQSQRESVQGLELV